VLRHEVDQGAVLSEDELGGHGLPSSDVGAADAVLVDRLPSHRADQVGASAQRSPARPPTQRCTARPGCRRSRHLLRRAIAPRLHWIPGLRDRLRLLDSETPPLGPFALVEGRGLRMSLNGQLCPNARLAEDIRYDVTRGGFVFVTGVPLSPQQRAGRPRYPGARGGTGTPLYRWLADGKAAAALVRPDFTVLRAGRDVARLCEAAPRFLVASGTCPPARR
jgi:hypothetical protein